MRQLSNHKYSNKRLYGSKSSKRTHAHATKDERAVWVVDVGHKSVQVKANSGRRAANAAIRKVYGNGPPPVDKVAVKHVGQGHGDWRIIKLRGDTDA